MASAVLGIAVSYSDLYLFHIALIVTILSFLHTSKFRFKKLRVHLHWIFYLMIIWYSVSIFWSDNKYYSLQYIFYLFCGISTVLITIYYANTIEKLESIFKILMIFFIAEILIALLESFNVIRLPISPYSNIVGFFGRNSKLPGLPDRIQVLFEHTPTGFNWNQNNLAFVMNLILPFFLFAKKNLVKIVGALSIYFIIYRTQSRVNIIAYFMIIAIVILFINKYKWLFRGISILIIMIALVVGNNFAWLQSSPLGRAIESAETLITGKLQEKNSIGLRQRYIKNGLVALKNTYGVGVGAGNSGNAKYHPDIYEGYSHYSIHNFWIEILVDGGILFAFAFLSWYAFMVFTLFYISKLLPIDSNLQYYCRSSAVSLTGFLIGAVSASSVIYDLPMWLLFGFSIACINIYRNEKVTSLTYK